MDTTGNERTEATGPAGAEDGGLPDQIADLVDDVTRDEKPPDDRRLAALFAETARDGAHAVGRGMRGAGQGARAVRHGVLAGSRWLADQVIAMAPRLPVRDQHTLRRHFPGHSPEELAEALIESAARSAAAVGAAVGAWSVLPIVPAFPVEVAAETLGLVGIEIKMIAELHEVYGMRAPGHVADRMTAYVAAWAHRRGVGLAPGGVIFAMGSPLARRLRLRLTVRAVRSAFSLGPLLTGAAAGGLLNRAETRRLGRDVREDLRRRAPIVTHWPDDGRPAGDQAGR